MYRQFARLGSLGVAFLIASPSLADEVVLVPNATVKGATGGRVRGTVQSESQTEVVVRLGANNTTVPTDQIVSIRYDSQPASMALAESAENAGQLAKAADLYKKAAGEASSKPFIEQTAKFKQAEVSADLALSDSRNRPKPSHCSTPFSPPIPTADTPPPRSKPSLASRFKRETPPRLKKPSPLSQSSLMEQIAPRFSEPNCRRRRAISPSR